MKKLLCVKFFDFGNLPFNFSRAEPRPEWSSFCETKWRKKAGILRLAQHKLWAEKGAQIKKNYAIG